MGLAMGMGILMGVRFAIAAGSFVRMGFRFGAGRLVRMGFVGAIRCSVGARFDGGTVRLAGIVRRFGTLRWLSIRSPVGIRLSMLVIVVMMMVMVIVGDLQTFDTHSVLIDHQSAQVCRKNDGDDEYRSQEEMQGFGHRRYALTTQQTPDGQNRRKARDRQSQSFMPFHDLVYAAAVGDGICRNQSGGSGRNGCQRPKIKHPTGSVP